MYFGINKFVQYSFIKQCSFLFSSFRILSLYCFKLNNGLYWLKNHYIVLLFIFYPGLTDILAIC